MRCLLLLLTILLFQACSLGPFTTTSHVERSEYETGQLKSLVMKHTRKYNTADLYSFYQRTRTSTIEFYPDSVIRSFSNRITRAGEGGGACFEEKKIRRDYSQEGILRSEVISFCDGRKVITRLFDNQGKLIFEQIDKRYL